MQPFTFSVPVDLTFGVGTIATLGDKVRGLGRRVQVITDRGLVAAGVAEQVIEVLKRSGLEVVLFTEVEENPKDTTCIKATEQYLNEGCEVVIGLGGGSPMDVAKLVAIMAANPGKHPREFEGKDKFANDPKPLVHVPTTAGTASEVTYFAVVTDTERIFKFTVVSNKIPPRIAVLDPALTVGKPPGLTAATGMDALTHAIESFTNRVDNPISDAMAIRAISLIGGALRKAVVQGQDLQARSDMLLGSLLAGMAFTQTRLGLVHAMSHPISAYFGVPHGVANALLLPAVLEFNLFGAIEKTAEIGRLLGEDLSGLSSVGAGRAGVEAVRRLSDDVGIPHWLKDVGVRADKIDVMADDTLKSGNIPVNPRLVKKQDVVALYTELMG